MNAMMRAELAMLLSSWRGAEASWRRLVLSRSTWLRYSGRSRWSSPGTLLIRVIRWLSR